MVQVASTLGIGERARWNAKRPPAPTSQPTPPPAPQAPVTEWGKQARGWPKVTQGHPHWRCKLSVQLSSAIVNPDSIHSTSRPKGMDWSAQQDGAGLEGTDHDIEKPLKPSFQLSSHHPAGGPALCWAGMAFISVAECVSRMRHPQTPRGKITLASCAPHRPLPGPHLHLAWRDLGAPLFQIPTVQMKILRSQDQVHHPRS